MGMTSQRPASATLAALTVLTTAVALCSAQHSIYQLSAKTLSGTDIDFKRFEGHVLLVVNVASHCGYTKENYEQLQEIQDKYKDDGLVVLLFPSNQFQQEPGSPGDIARFLKKNGWRLPMMEKCDVNGPNTHPIFKFLKWSGPTAYPEVFDVQWNFEKFLVNKSGECEKRFGTDVKPMDIEKTIKKLLAEPNPFQDLRTGGGMGGQPAGKEAVEKSEEECNADLPPGA